ncbi:uncharacterized protein B0I36DRAFT_367030 [Microdochium trichocladiopsis]|uniref:Uncharacterized protein n=1 Tax=Microdochium trichocladiopsis TaxID=1682393 RepID=A0A9P8Y1K5_9PEZI|nr:uncharacterized protein B0I36DRAFT_367030 [Microdochium trichocladiopsis]KAH7025146.1 hypothetical protein B0I36DRAFT_367030 [Microdochium trichocladiopsis]
MWDLDNAVLHIPALGGRFTLEFDLPDHRCPPTSGITIQPGPQDCIVEDAVFPAKTVLEKWGSYYLVEWENDEITWVTKSNVSEDLVTNFETNYKGFGPGVQNIVASRWKGRREQLRLAWRQRKLHEACWVDKKKWKSSPKMGRKRTAEEKRRYAEENGFNDDDTDVDDNPIPRDVLDYTKERYDVQMELWLEYKTTHPEATPHDLKTLKHFAEFMAKSIKGLLDPNGKPTVQTVRNYFRCFVSGWNIDNPKSLISRDHTDSITNYIKGPLKKKLGLSTATRPRTYLTLENYMYMERQLWQSDGHEYVHDGYRVLISAKLKCHVFTSARVGEITIEQVLAVKPPTDQKYWVLEWADHVHALDLPVFPEMSPDGPTQKIQSASAFCTQVRQLSLRAGMEQLVTVHGIRRESLIQATSNGYSKDELMKFAAHTNQMTMTRDYLSSITVVDGLGGFLKLPLRSDQAEDFRSMTVKRNPELFLSMPAKTQDELRQREDYVAITKKLEDLSFETNAETRTAIRNQLLKQRRMLEKEELNRVRRYILTTDGSTSSNAPWRTTREDTNSLNFAPYVTMQWQA